MTEQPTEEQSPPPEDQDETKEPVDPALLEQAVLLLKEACKGNGINPAHIELDEFEGEVLHFDAYSTFKIEAQTAEKTMPGREQGRVVGSRQEARNEVKRIIEKACTDADIKKQTMAALQRRKDKGFFADGFIMSFDKLKKTFVVHEVCTACSGKAKSACPECRGQGRVQCNFCRGTREAVCHICRGSRQISTPQGRQTCTECHGRGKTPCLKCNSTGMLNCIICKTTGLVDCRPCSGTGWNSHITNLVLKAKSLFSYDKQALPQEVPPLIDELKSNLLIQGHADVQFIEDKERIAEIEHLLSRPDEYVIPYHVRLPWGDIDFMVKTKPLAGKLFGFVPTLRDMPPFLETTTRKGQKALAEAVSHPARAAGKIGQAVKYRLIAETVLAVAGTNLRKAADSMAARYPFGIRIEAVRQIVKNADLGLKNVTKTPRMVGLGAGLAFSGALYALYFPGPGREKVINMMPSEGAETALDLLVLAGGGFLTLFAIRLSAARALRNTLGALVSTDKRKSVTPKAGLSGLLGFAGAAVLYFALMEWSIRGGGGIPGWYEPVRTALGL